MRDKKSDILLNLFTFGEAKDSTMAETIKKYELPVIITKLKIGKKDLTKSLIEQLPLGLYVSHKWEYHDEIKTVYGLSLKDNNHDSSIYNSEYDKTVEHFIDGTLIGFVNIKLKEEVKSNTFALYAKRIDHHSIVDSCVRINNFSTEGYLILWYDENGMLKKGYIDQWTVEQLGIELEHIIV